MYKLTWQKPIKINKKDLYTIDLLSWSGAEDILTICPSSKEGLVNIESGVIVTNPKGIKSIVGVILSGLTEGIETIKLEYTTATRCDSVEIDLIVGETCLTH